MGKGMTGGAWYWYPHRCQVYCGQVHVAIHQEKPDTVRGRYWVIPWRGDGEGRWNVYLEPWYRQAPDGTPYTDQDARGNCEWVFSHKERPPHYDCDETCETCYPPPKEYDNCPCCGEWVEKGRIHED